MIKGFLLGKYLGEEVTATSTDGKIIAATLARCDTLQDQPIPCVLPGIAPFCMVVLPKDMNECYDCLVLEIEDINPNLLLYVSDVFSIRGACSVFLVQKSTNEYKPVPFEWSMEWIAENLQYDGKVFTKRTKSDFDDEDEEEGETEKDGNKHGEMKSDSKEFKCSRFSVDQNLLPNENLGESIKSVDTDTKELNTPVICHSFQIGDENKKDKSLVKLSVQKLK